MIGILSQNHDFDLVDRCEFKSLENLSARRIYRLSRRLFLVKVSYEIFKIRFFKFVLEGLFLALFNLNIHFQRNQSGKFMKKLP